jgi:hypothetical protein
MLRSEIDHDRLFKELLSTFFVEFVDLFFPEMAAYLDRDSLTPLDRRCSRTSPRARSTRPTS